MSRLLPVVLACLLLSSCATETATPAVDLGQVAERARTRMNEMGTATFRTEMLWGGVIGYEVAGVWRYDAAGVSATMNVRRTKPKGSPVVEAVLVPGSIHWRPHGTTRYDVEVDPTKFAALLTDPFRRKLHDDLVELKRPIVARVWVDATGLPLKAGFVLPFDERRETTTWFENWGRPVEIAVPAV